MFDRPPRLQGRSVPPPAAVNCRSVESAPAGPDPADLLHREVEVEVEVDAVTGNDRELVGASSPRRPTHGRSPPARPTPAATPTAVAPLRPINPRSKGRPSTSRFPPSPGTRPHQRWRIPRTRSAPTVGCVAQPRQGLVFRSCPLRPLAASLRAARCRRCAAQAQGGCANVPGHSRAARTMPRSSAVLRHRHGQGRTTGRPRRAGPASRSEPWPEGRAPRDRGDVQAPH